jgi:chaperone protein EcpD
VKILARNTLMTMAVTVAGVLTTQAIASVVITGTRVIYPSDAKEVSVKLNNMGKGPVLIQNWIDKGDADAKPESIKVPFILTPPMNRVDPNKGQTLRISYAGGMLPMDKESVFWLNVLEIPAKSQAKANENYLQMAFRSRIKLFYRPIGLEGNANDAAKAVTWSSKGGSLQATNPTPYYVSFVTLSVNGKRVEGDMMAPHSSLNIALPSVTGNTLKGEFVNDYGAVNTFEAVIE